MIHDPAPKTNGDHKQTKVTEPDVLKRLPRQPRASREFLSCYVDAKTDSTNHPVQKASRSIALAALGFVAVGGLILMASWLLLSGMAEGLGLLLGDKSWLGNSVTGFLTLACLGLGIYYTVARRKRASRERT
jgi:hypothetical protein